MSSSTLQITHINFAKGFRGGERQTQLLIEELDRRGVMQTLLVRPGSQLPTLFHTCKHLKIHSVSKPYIRGLPYLRHSDLIHAHETKGAQLALWSHLFLKTPYILTRRVDTPISSNPFNRALYHKALCCVALSHPIAQEIQKIAPQAKITIIPSATAAQKANPSAVLSIRHRFQKNFLIGHIGALVDRHKGQMLSIQALESLHQEYPELHLLFLGQGEDELRLRQRCKKKEFCTFEGFVTNVPDYLEALDLLIFPSRNEGLGSTLLDAMYAGVPIIASDVGGIPEIIHHESTGLLIPPNDSKALAQAIKRVYQDATLRTHLRQNAKKFAQKYRPEIMADRYMNLYQKLLKNIL